MTFTQRQQDFRRMPFATSAPSRALQLLWQKLAPIRHPHFLECGPVSQATLDVLLLRGARLYVADLITPARQNNGTFWSRQGKKAVFLADDFLAQIPAIPPESVSAVCCWSLLDLLPRQALPALVERFYSLLQPGGVLFCILREPYLATGAEARWWFDTLTVLGSNGGNKQPFPYPALTNREMERLFPGGNVKTFLTRSGRREVLGTK
jgi:hypothetical protein